MYGRMNVDFVLRVQGQDLYDGDSALDALADDIVAAMFSGYGMDPADVSATVGYAHDLDYTNILYVPGEADSVQAEAVMTFEIRFLRSNGKEVGHTGYMP
ncbi:MAG: hypothetical protein JKY94_16795 [Rhodobacteraceae bacterium]|nr:hypothetical protein [Paracoccaceae bacterium]